MVEPFSASMSCGCTTHSIPSTTPTLPSTTSTLTSTTSTLTRVIRHVPRDRLYPAHSSSPHPHNLALADRVVEIFRGMRLALVEELGAGASGECPGAHSPGASSSSASLGASALR